MAERTGTIKCSGCGKRIDPVVWSMCQLQSHCYHCGAEIPVLQFDALAKLVTGSAN